MTPREAYDLSTGGGGGWFARVAALCARAGRYCLIGGLAVNCYVEPVYTLDADLVVVAAAMAAAQAALMEAGFELRTFPFSVNATTPESQLRLQFATDPRYQTFLDRASEREVLGVRLPVAALEDVAQGKLWAWADPERRRSKRKKDELDLMRLAEAYPALAIHYPPELRRQLE